MKGILHDLPANKLMRMNLRMPAWVFKDIDDLIARRETKIARNTWIHEAVLEKISRERKDEGYQESMNIASRDGENLV